MAVGLPANKSDIDYRAGNVVLNLRNALREVEAFNSYLNTLDDADLADVESGGVGYTADEITLLRASYVDLTKLSRIAHGQDEQVGPNNFFWNAAHLTGPA